MKNILFLGDSITESGRPYTNDSYYGGGYVTLVAGKILTENIGKYKVINRGVAGEHSGLIRERVQADCVDLKPDVLTILLGINDLSRTFRKEAELYPEVTKSNLQAIISAVREDNPDVRIILMTPFLTEGNGSFKDTYPSAIKELPKYAAAIKEVAKENGLEVVELQPIFEKAQTKAPATYWTIDGVHPTTAGHALIAEAWLRVFGE